MAGGRGTRLKSPVEKPMLLVGGRTMLQRVTDTLKQSKLVSRLIVAVTDFTPETAREARELELEVLVTPGLGYEADMRYAINRLALGNTLVLSADIPLITVEIVENAIRKFESSGKPALSVMSPAEIYERLGVDPGYVFQIGGNKLVPVGINLIDGTKIDQGELDQEILVAESDSICFNVNTLRELELVQSRCER